MYSCFPVATEFARTFDCSLKLFCMTPAFCWPSSGQRLVLFVFPVLISGQTEGQSASVELFHRVGKMVSIPWLHASYNCMHGQCEVNGLSILTSSPPAKYKAFVAECGSISQLGCPGDGMGWFESERFQQVVGVAGRGYFQTPAPDHGAASQGNQIAE